MMHRSLAICAAQMLVLATSAAEPVFTVRPAQVLRRDADRVVGIDLNYLRDADANRPAGSRSLDAALADLGVRRLRYPGGEKSDFHRFAAPPYARPAPVALGWYATVAGTRMDFDAYLAHCRAAGAEPHVVVACDSPANTGATWDEQLEHAVAWVRYAKEHGGLVRWFEIGNENWHNRTAPPAEMAVQVSRFAKAMRAADPSIRLAASGSDAAWWAAFLPGAARDLDALSVSVYNCWAWKSYDRLLAAPEPDLLGAAGAALRAIDALPDPADRARLQVIVAETNSVDYSEGGWKNDNTLGHALVAFETFGRQLREPRIVATMLWNTRWVEDDKAPTDNFYALDSANRLLPAGQAVGLWGRHLRRDLVAIDGGSATLRAHASAGPDGAWTVWLVNRGRQAEPMVRIALGGLAARRATVWCFHGSGSEDRVPVLDPPVAVAVADGTVGPQACPPLSVTVIAGDP